MKLYIETDRLILREILPTDVEGMFELDSDPLVHKYLGNHPISTKEEAHKIIEYIREQYDKRGVGRWAAIEKATGDFIGWSGLKLNIGKNEELNGFDEFYDIGYRLIPRFWGRGFATESAIVALDYGFKELHINTIYGAAEVDNIGSNKILKKIGLKFVNTFSFEDGLAHWYELKNEDYAKTMS
ncbi:MAG: N-acetyltransferase [Flavobacteriaceae bacterium]|nr:MAG: N-acetyltransferase [Flavobacteriaceae bacterium]